VGLEKRGWTITCPKNEERRRGSREVMTLPQIIRQKVRLIQSNSLNNKRGTRRGYRAQVRAELSARQRNWKKLKGDSCAQCGNVVRVEKGTRGEDEKALKGAGELEGKRYWEKGEARDRIGGGAAEGCVRRLQIDRQNS